MSNNTHNEPEYVENYSAFDLDGPEHKQADKEIREAIADGLMLGHTIINKDHFPALCSVCSHSEQVKEKPAFVPAPGHAQSKEKIRLQIARHALDTLNNPAIVKTAEQELELMALIERCTHKEFRRKAKKKPAKKKANAASPFDI